MSDDREKGEIILSILRIALGWLFMWPFFDKLFGLGFRTPAGGAVIDGVSPSSYVVYQTGGVFGDLFNSLAGNAFIDVLFMFALIAIGISLIFGIASKLGTLGASLFFITMYLIQVPPLDNPLIDYHIICLLAILAVYFLGGFRKLSLYEKWTSLWIVKRFPILE